MILRSEAILVLWIREGLAELGVSVAWPLAEVSPSAKAPQGTDAGSKLFPISILGFGLRQTRLEEIRILPGYRAQEAVNEARESDEHSFTRSSIARS